MVGRDEVLARHAAIALSTQGSFTPLVRSWLSIMARRAVPGSAPVGA
jgi:hypothetical protein